MIDIKTAIDINKQLIAGVPMKLGSIIGDEINKIQLEALEKQMPKECKSETINHGIGVSGEYDIESYYLCPVCNAVVGDALSEELNGPYCHKCGQAIFINTNGED